LTVARGNAERACYGESGAKHSLLIRDGETGEECVFFMMAGNKNKTHFQPKQDSGACGQQRRSTAPVQREHTGALPEKCHTCAHTHTHTHRGAFPAKGTVITAEKYGHRWIKAPNFEGLQRHSEDRQTTTRYPEEPQTHGPGRRNQANGIRSESICACV